MLKKVIEWVKENPWLTAAFAAGIVVLLWLMSRRSSAAAAASTDPTASQGVAGTGLSESGYLTLQEAGLTASQNIQAVQLQAAVQTNAQQTALQTAQADYANQLSIAQLQSQVSLASIQATASSNDQATAAALTANLATTGAGVQEAQIGADEATTIAGYQEQVQLAQIGATTAANNVIANLASIIAGGSPSTAPPPPTAVPVVVPTVPPTQTTTGPTSPPVTSQPPAVVTQPGTAPAAAASSGLIPYGNLSNEQWYELISLETNQPLANIESIYGTIQPGSTITNLQQTVGAHSTAGSAYGMYQAGAIVNTPAGSPYAFAYGGPYQQWALSGAAVNTWAVPHPAGTPLA
jgi:hypothetical protein